MKERNYEKSIERRKDKERDHSTPRRIFKN